MTERTVATTIHGRYLAVPPAAAGPAPMLVGFHGYGEDAETQLGRLRAIPGSEGWLVVSIQGLHRFYQRSTNRVVAGWMTRQDRELAIADNIAYVNRCLAAAAAEWPVTPVTVFAGFSQGVAMAWRAAVHATSGAASVIAVGGDVPPELAPDSLRRIPAALIARGASDEWYTREQFSGDETRLRNCAVDVRVLEYGGGHEWAGEIAVAAADFLRARRP